MDTGLAVVLDLVDRLTEQEREQVTAYLLAKRSQQATGVSDQTLDPAELQRRLQMWLEEVERLEPEPPIALSGLEKEYEDALVEKYRQQGLKL